MGGSWEWVPGLEGYFYAYINAKVHSATFSWLLRLVLCVGIGLVWFGLELGCGIESAMFQVPADTQRRNHAGGRDRGGGGGGGGGQ